jgi:HD-like signal output (HDOD) protein
MAAAKSLKEQITDYISQSGLQLPMFNAVALKLQSTLKDENATPATMEAILAEDPALAGQVLRMANSSAFAGLAQIATMKQALMRLGMTQVARLALAAAQLSLYCSKSALISEYMGDLWRQAYVSARGACWLSEKCGRPAMAESAFLAGLLHDIGKLLILRALEEIAEKGNAQAMSRSLVDEMVESLHCEIGYGLMKRWNLPEAYCLVARDHHREKTDPSQVLIAVVRLMDQVCARLGIGSHSDPAVVPAASPEAQALGITEVQLAELEIEIEDCLPAAA